MSVQFIKSARPGKPVTWYIYAFRGGPLIRKAIQPRKPGLTRDDHTAIAAALVADRAIDPTILRAALREWCPADPKKDDSPEWAALSDNTKRVWRPEVDLIEARWGKFPIAVWNDPLMVTKVMKWRNERKNTPRSADMGIQVLDAFLTWAKLNGRVLINVAAKIPRLYRGGNRAEIIWTKDDIARFEAKAKELDRQQMIDGLRLAAVTGLRREDLITVTWSQVGEFAIVKRALKKSRGKRRRVIIPQTPQLEAVLAELRTRRRRPGVDTVLVNRHGKPWTVNGFGVSFSRMLREVSIIHTDEDGVERKKHLHDVRGTFCTMLLTEWELTDEEAAEIMGWSPERVATIRKVYVDQFRTVVALGERIAAKQIAKQSGGASGN
jgi:integrase